MAFREARDDQISGYEYVRGDVTTNTVEGFFSIFGRGMKGVYQHCGEKHLHRYLAEFDYRYNHRIALGFNDGDPAAIAVKSADGKRLTYRQSHIGIACQDYNPCTIGDSMVDTTSLKV